MQVPSYKFYFNKNATNLDVILHGSSDGMDSQFITKIWNASVKNGSSTVAFNFPYLERGDANSSGGQLAEEVDALESILKVCQSGNYRTTRLIGKSLGGIVANYFLKNLPEDEKGKYSIVIFGYIPGSIDLKSFPGKIDIIQGSQDRFGDIEKVKGDLGDTLSKNIKFYSVEGADHSYRNPETKEPVFEDQAVECIFPNR